MLFNARRDNTCAHHCGNFALSDPLDKDLQKKCSRCHLSSCNRNCENLKETLEDIKKFITSFSTNMYSKEQQEDLLYDYYNVLVHKVNNGKPAYCGCKIRIKQSTIWWMDWRIIPFLYFVTAS